MAGYLFPYSDIYEGWKNEESHTYRKDMGPGDSLEYQERWGV